MLHRLGAGVPPGYFVMAAAAVQTQGSFVHVHVAAGAAALDVALHGSAVIVAADAESLGVRSFQPVPCGLFVIE